MSKTGIKRIPRPLGLTSLMVEYHKTEGENKLKLYYQVKAMLINHWLVSNGNICGVNYSINALSSYIGCDVSDIQIHMRDKLVNSRIWDKDVQETMLNALMGQQLMWLMEDRMDIQNQVEILKQSQGNQYKAFISSELNKALKLKLDSTSAMQSMVKNSTGNVNIFAPIQNNINNTQNNNGVTVEDALQIITQKMEEIGANTKDADVLYLESKYNFEDTEEYPEVVASLQVGKGDKEGLSLKKQELNMAIDSYKLHVTDAFEEDHHATRREVEDMIDPDDDDPELDEYPDIEEE